MITTTTTTNHILSNQEGSHITSSEQESMSRSRNGRVRFRRGRASIPLQMEEENSFAVLYSREESSEVRSIDEYSCDGSSSDSCDDLGDFGSADDEELQELNMRIKKIRDERAKKRRSSKKLRATKIGEEKYSVQISTTPKQTGDPELVTVGSYSESSFRISQRIETIRRKREQAERELSLAISLREELHEIVSILDKNADTSEPFTSCTQTLHDLQMKVARLTGRSISPPHAPQVTTDILKRVSTF
jgi:hypothetical protein